MPSTMRAVDIRNGTGPATSLFINDSTPKPTAGPTDAIVKIKAFGLNRMDLLQRMGMYPVPPQASKTLGVEFSGIIEGFGGEAEKGFSVGDEVFGLAYGGEFQLWDPAIILSISPCLGDERGQHPKVESGRSTMISQNVIVLATQFAMEDDNALTDPDIRCLCRIHCCLDPYAPPQAYGAFMGTSSRYSRGVYSICVTAFPSNRPRNSRVLEFSLMHHTSSTLNNSSPFADFHLLLLQLFEFVSAFSGLTSYRRGSQQPKPSISSAGLHPESPSSGTRAPHPSLYPESSSQKPTTHLKYS